MLNLFNELWWLSDGVKPMEEFCEILTEWCEWVQFYAIAKIINPEEFGFGIHPPYIIHNLRENNTPDIESASETIEYIMECYKEYDDKEYWEDFWIPRVKKIIEKYE